jgi:hypothetical protein
MKFSLPDTRSGYKVNERPRQFTLDKDTFEIDAVVEEQCRSPEAEFFRCGQLSGKHYLLPDDEI